MTVAAIAIATLVLQPVLNSGLSGAGGPEVSLMFQPDPPVPFEPMTVTAARDNCAPGDGQVTVNLVQSVQDVVWWTPMASREVLVGGDGRVEVTLDDLIAYPGHWQVEVLCPGEATPSIGSFEVSVPVQFALEVELSVLRRGEPFTIALTGTGCVGGVADWELAVPPVAFLGSGTVSPDGGGGWSTTSSGVVPASWMRDSVGLQVWCTFADGVIVQYELPSSLSTQVLPAVIDDGDNDDPVVIAGPRFTG